MFRSQRTPLFAFAALLILAGWALWPGLHGGFLFDDYPNLELLGSYGRIDNGATFLRYMTSGFADPTGRPLSMLSFLLDARNWPADPYPFKRTNLLLHLFNGILLFAVLRQLGRAFVADARRCGAAAALGAGLWLAHPFLVSTTLYIVQREAMLPTTFTLAALWIWLRGREKLLLGEGSRAALAWMTMAVLMGTLLAVASKANGVLLPPLLLAVECCLPAAALLSSLRRARLWLLAIPSILVLLALLASIPESATVTAAHRPWSLGQRMLTEPRVLLDYLGLLWLPRPYTRGLFNDTFALSTSLWHPWTTLPAMLAVGLMIFWAWRQRRRHATLALAMLYYFVGQAIESGPVPLELYFEHRNYLPATLMFWPLALWLTGSGSQRWLRHFLVAALPLGLAWMTHMSATLWGDPTTQALVWAEKNPDSPRAQAYAAQFEMRLGQVDQAEKRLRRVYATRPRETQVAINLIGTRCAAGSVSAGDLAQLGATLRSDPDPTRLGTKWLQEALPTAWSGQCPGLSPTGLKQLLSAFNNNPRTALDPGRRRDIASLRGQIALRENQPQLALEDFDRAVEGDAHTDLVLLQAAMLASAQQPSLALRHLRLVTKDIAKPWYRWKTMGDVHAWVLARQGFWQAQVDELRGKIEADLRATDIQPR